MLRKVVGMISIVVLVGLLSAVSFADAVQITFGPSTTGSVSSNFSAVSFSNVSGWAYQGANSGTFTLSNAVIAVGAGTDGVYTLAPNSETFTITMGAEWLIGELSLETVTSPGSATPLFIGTTTVTDASTGFRTSGYPLGSVNDTEFVGYHGHVSAGQIVPDPVPEPGTIAMVGSGLLAMAGFLRRRIF